MKEVLEYFRKASIISAILCLLMPCLLGAELSDKTNIPPADGIGRVKWIWFPEIAVAKGQVERFFRGNFKLAADIEQADLTLMADDEFTAWINGEKITEWENVPLEGMTVCKADLAKLLAQGENVLAVAVTNLAGNAGLIARLNYKLSDGREGEFFTDANWRCHDAKTDGFEHKDFDDSHWSSVWITGDAAIDPWGKLSADVFLSEQEKARHEEIDNCIARISDILKLREAEEAKVKLVHHGQITGIDVNGKIFPPYLYQVWHTYANTGTMYPRVLNTIAQMGNSGLNLIQYGLLSDIYMKSETERDEEYLGKVIKALESILAANPNAYFILNLCFRPPKWWKDANPDEMVVYATGPASDDDSPLSRQRTASLASEKWRDQAMVEFDKIVKTLSGSPVWKRVAGFRLSYGVYMEWHYFGMIADMPDLGPAMTREFRKYLQAKYGSEEALKKAYQDDSATFDTMTVPGIVERQSQGRFLRDPSRGPERKTMDYYDCQQKVTADLLLYWAKYVKQQFPEKLIGAWYGYFFEMAYPPDGQTVEFDKVLSSPYIDFLSSPYGYTAASRHPGGGGQPRIISSPFHRYGKLAFFEDDTRTHTAGAPHDLDTTTPVESESVLKRNFGVTLIENIGLQFNDGACYYNIPGWFDDPLQLQTVAEAVKVWRDFFRNPPQDDGCDIGVICSTDEMVRSGHSANISVMIDALTDQAVHAMRKAGRPVEIVRLQEYLASDRHYALTVFLNAFTLTDQERASLQARLAQDKNAVAWMYAPGLATEHGFSDEAMSELTGIRLHSRTQESLPLAIKLDNGEIVKYSDESPLRESPRVEVNDLNAEIWGYYAEYSTPALAFKNHEGRAVFFSGAPLNGEGGTSVWARIIDKAGLHRYADNNVILHKNGDILLVHTGKAGKYEIRLPRRARQITELFSGKILAQDCDSLLLEAKDTASWLLKLED